MKKVLLAGALLLAACSTGHGTAKPTAAGGLSVTGSVLVASRQTANLDGPGTQCWQNSGSGGAGGEHGAYLGGPVTVTDPSGKAVAAGTLGGGVVQAATAVDREGGRVVGACRFPFSVSGIPQGLSAYSISVAGQSVRITAAHLSDPVEIKIGF